MKPRTEYERELVAWHRLAAREEVEKALSVALTDLLKRYTALATRVAALNARVKARGTEAPTK